MAEQWDRNASTGSDILNVTANGRIIRQGLYRAEYWGDYSLDFPVKGAWRKTLTEARSDLAVICRESQK